MAHATAWTQHHKKAFWVTLAQWGNNWAVFPGRMDVVGMKQTLPAVRAFAQGVLRRVLGATPETVPDLCRGFWADTSTTTTSTSGDDGPGGPPELVPLPGGDLGACLQELVEGCLLPLLVVPVGEWCREDVHATLVTRYEALVQQFVDCVPWEAGRVRRRGGAGVPACMKAVAGMPCVTDKVMPILLNRVRVACADRGLAHAFADWDRAVAEPLGGGDPRFRAYWCLARTITGLDLGWRRCVGFLSERDYWDVYGALKVLF